MVLKAFRPFSPTIEKTASLYAPYLLQYLTGAETVKDIPLNGAIEYIDTFMLTMAMTALGTDTSLEKFKQAGAKPFLLAGLLYIWLVGGGYLLTQYITPMFE